METRQPPPITYQSLGVVRSPFRDPVGMPIQAVAAQGVLGTLELDPAYEAGLRDIDGFSHLIVIYHLHLSRPGSLLVTPFLDTQPHGIFATRSPQRPNAIGLSVVRLIRVEGARLHVEDVDMVDGTPILDLKPYVPQFDDRPAERIGWFAQNIARVGEARADRRFAREAAGMDQGDEGQSANAGRRRAPPAARA
jgi:tRNA-Thr(GGU) m(6)t(6)A37 methyltransferase TsaA